MKRLSIKIAIVLGLAMALIVPATPVGAQGSGGSCNTNARLLTFPTWWRGLEIDSSTCSVKIGDNLEKDIAKIVTNIVEIILQLVGYASVVFIIVGGFHYLAAAGDPGRVMRGRKTIQNAIIGLIISLMSVGIVNVVAGSLG